MLLKLFLTSATLALASTPIFLYLWQLAKDREEQLKRSRVRVRNRRQQQ